MTSTDEKEDTTENTVTWLIQKENNTSSDDPSLSSFSVKWRKRLFRVLENTRAFHKKPVGVSVLFAFLVITPLSTVGAGSLVHGAVDVPSSQSTELVASSPVEVSNIQGMPLAEPTLSFNPHPSVGGGSVSVVDNSALLAVGGVSEPTIVSGGDDTKDGHWSGRVSIYVVRPGDTVSQIAKLFAVSANTVRWANDISKGETIQVGQRLVILPATGIEVTVKKGETVKSITARYGADYQEVLNYNNISRNDTVKTGTKLIIPNAIMPSSSSHEEGASHVSRKKSSVSHSGGVPARTFSPQVHGVDNPGYFMAPLKSYIETQGIHGHNAVDLAPRDGSIGASIYAAASGEVIVSRDDGGWNGGYGNFVVINHPNGEQTLYAHMSQDIVHYGQHVVQGQVIGYVGSTGESTGPHVHFEVHGGINPF